MSILDYVSTCLPHRWMSRREGGVRGGGSYVLICAKCRKEFRPVFSVVNRGRIAACRAKARKVA